MKYNCNHIRAKVVFKTKDECWVDCVEPVVILVSIHSFFHEPVKGDLKMRALLHTIKTHVKGKVTVLLADRAHIRCMSLELKANLSRDISALEERYKSYFEGCDVRCWHAYIYEDEHFPSSYATVLDLYRSDPSFQSLVAEEGKSDEGIEDILEQCACVVVLSKKGYRFQFYPGRPYRSVEYLREKVEWVHVFLAIERCSITNTDAIL